MALFSILQELINLNLTYKGITGKKKSDIAETWPVE